MVKGVSRQVIVIHAPDPKLFEQAIFILKDEAVGREGITDELLLKEAKRIISGSGCFGNRNELRAAPIWTVCGAALTGLIWALTVIF